MSWQLFDTSIVGNQSQILLDDQFVADIPGEELPNLAWFGVWCQMDTEGRYWNHAETDTLDLIESNLLRMASHFSNGWAVYVRRSISAGKREYFFYYGGDAALDLALPEIQKLHPEYRIEYENEPDPLWSLYKTWLTEMSDA